MPVIRLTSADVDLLVDVDGAPTIVHWGQSLGNSVGESGDFESIAAMVALAPVVAGLDAVAPLAVVPEQAVGFPGQPGLLGHRPDGTAWAPRFTTVDVDHDEGENKLAVTATADDAGLLAVTEFEATPRGGFRLRTAIENTADTSYQLDELSVSVPIAPHAAETLTFHGRWSREFAPQRQAFDHGAIVATNRRGRTSHENPPVVWAGSRGFGEHHGEVWGAHLAWSGNSRVAVERLADGRCRFQLGELFQPAEVSLAPGERYTTPWVVLAHSALGLTPASRQYHAYVRHHGPRRSAPRPVTLNIWEAVEYDHSPERLRELATRAAELGVERFVVDDGWFASRRDDTSGLGDWWVSPDAHPDGLTPLIDHVRTRGMTFGIWVEPEMVNPDSELYRAHPDWVLGGRDPLVLGRHQLVLDLARPDVYAEIVGRMHALLGDHWITFVKWDMNRDHANAHGADGRAGSRGQTLAVYRMIDELRAAHPDVEFESCASGGGRIDLGILERVERVWTSDCNDPVERQQIQRWATTLLPLEVLGAHVGVAINDFTGRRLDVNFAAATALFGSFGFERDLLALTADEHHVLARWVDRYKSARELLHTGDFVRIDDLDPSGATVAHGVLSADRTEGLIAVVQLATAQAMVPPPVRIPELDPDRAYRVAVDPISVNPAARLTKTRMTVLDGVTATGRQLAVTGVRLPALAPESATVLTITAEG